MLGYDRTVIPQVQNALLGRHDFILLGLRGQAKSRLVRLLPALLDEYVPEVAGSEIHDDPLDPGQQVRPRPRRRAWATTRRSRGCTAPLRYGEKLATPDTSIADLIGDIDPIKAATRKLTYADEEVIHFGIIPRTHRGIFAINELPDLQPRIQVGLLNIMEEQDIQIRGFNVRIPIDVLMVFTANPEDYTNRGSIITPLKDRIDSQILTHYPKDLGIGVAITRQEAWATADRRSDAAVTVHVPHVYREIVEQVAFEARQSEYVDQKSGVSARLTRAALEDLVSAAERRALVNGETETTVRASDLQAIEPAVTGKVELVYEGEQEGAASVARALIGKAVATITKTVLPDPADKETGRAAYGPILRWFSAGNRLVLDAEMPQGPTRPRSRSVDGLRQLVTDRTRPGTDAAGARRRRSR